MFSASLKRLPHIQTQRLAVGQSGRHAGAARAVGPSLFSSVVPKIQCAAFSTTEFGVPKEDVEFAIETGEVSARRPAPKSKHGMFFEMVLVCFSRIVPANAPWSQISEEFGAFGIKSMSEYLRERSQFRGIIDKSMSSSMAGFIDPKTNPLYNTLRQSFVRGGMKSLRASLRYAFQMYLFRHNLSEKLTQQHSKLADMRFPWEWFPATRAMPRTVHLHVGPTNSGKTYHALKALEEARSGIYCGPLRLLAHEIYSRFQAKNKPCALMTGEEQRIPQDVDDYFISCTVEMTPLSKPVDVAVIDEIQMISDDDRGSGWTSAFLGLQAKELHLCGEERTVDIIKSLCDSIGDKCIVHRYQRLTPLKAAETTVSKDFSDLQKGDCIVAFSRVNLHAMKDAIETATGRRCAIIYGSLPPEVRAQQAELFNNPDNEYDFMVASDAIGMGLNLEIKRVIFETTTKNDGYGWRELTVSELRQIGGRAGRFKTARQGMLEDNSLESKVGIVTTLEPSDLKVVQAKLWKDAPPIDKVSVFPPVAVIEQFAQYFPPATPFKFVLLRLKEIATLSNRFNLFIKDELLQVADLIQPFDLDIHDRCVLLTAPAYLRDPMMKHVVTGVAKCIANGGGGELLNIPEIPLTTLDIDMESVPIEQHKEYMRMLESLHGAIVLYLWVSYRFPGVFTSQQMAFKVRGMVQEKINQGLERLAHTDGELELNRKAQRAMAYLKKREEEKLLADEAEVEAMRG
ncbi:hypothetical protein TD95_004798 [Thielaviopsis punctulata]|uniref:RNA helicase n=1 Tax=Thielaviopsis punctulata TaxID=72032 RepID=A0A0F4ZH46_9PEZI|nr:hypothetical protein TD95_004798 [Thielaviopsis punctulata]